MSHPDNEFRAGWGVVLAATVGIMASCITLVNYSLGVFVVPLSRDFGWSRHEIMLATTFVTSGALATSFIAGWLSDRIAVGRLIVFSQAGFGLAFCALAAFGDRLAAFYAIYLSMAVLAGGTLPITFTKIVAARFERHRGLALGLALSGTGFAGFLIPPYVGHFVNTYGWRVGYLAVAAVPLCLAMPLSLAFLWRTRHAARAAVSADAGYGLTFGQALRSWRFWVVALAFFVASGAATGVSANIVPMMIDRGFAPQTAANLAAAYGLAVIAGRVIIGALADRFWAPPVAAVFLVPAGIATVLLAIMPLSFASAVPLIAVIGLATGAEGDLLSYMVTRYFGIRAYGRIFSGIFVAFIAAIAVSAPLFGYAYDATRSYVLAMEIAAAGWVLCAGLLFTLGPYPRWPHAAASD